MTYCTLDDVKHHIPWLVVSDTSKPSTAQATAYLTTIASQIDGVLRGRGITLPVTNSSGLAYLKTVAIYGAAMLCVRGRFPDGGGTGGDAGSAAMWEKLYRHELDSGLLGVADQPRDGGQVGEGFTRDCAGEPHAAFATRRMEW